MSSLDRRLVLSARAQDDFAGILQNTLEIRGEEKMLEYRQVVDDGLMTIMANPMLGFTRPSVSQHHRFLSVGQHLIAYRVSDTLVEVSRILHGRMDIKRHL